MNMNLFLWVITPFLKHWYCIGFVDNIQDIMKTKKPYCFSIENQSFQLWKSRENNGGGDGYTTTTKEHELIGRNILFRDKIYWSYYDLESVTPYVNPFIFGQYEKICIELDTLYPIQDAILNTMNRMHPQHSQFPHPPLPYMNNEKIQIKNIHFFQYDESSVYSTSSLGMSFDYFLNHKNIKEFVYVKNYYTYVYPFYSYHCMSFHKNNVIIEMEFLPIYECKTRHFITIYHNLHVKKDKNLYGILQSIVNYIQGMKFTSMLNSGVGSQMTFSQQCKYMHNKIVNTFMKLFQHEETIQFLYKKL